MDGLLIGSTCNRDYTNYLTLVEYLSGNGLYYPLTIFKARPCKLSALKGGFKVHNSYRITPKLQISVLKE